MFKKSTLLRILIAAGLTSGLVACGGGSDDHLPSADSYVTGTFKDASIDGIVYPNLARYAGGQNGRTCFGQTHYFETEDGRVRVYGSTAFSETDYRVVSTMIHSRLDLVLNKFGMSWNEFVDQRPIFNRDHLERLVNEYGGAIDSSWVSPEKAADSWTAWDALTLEEQLMFAEQSYRRGAPPAFALPNQAEWNAMAHSKQLTVAGQHYNSFNPALHGWQQDDWVEWQALSGAEQQQYMESIALHLPPPMNDILLPREALVACLSPGMSGSQFGEGSQLGIQIPPEVSTYHAKVGEIFTHEIVHFIQTNISDVEAVEKPQIRLVLVALSKQTRSRRNAPFQALQLRPGCHGCNQLPGTAPARHL